MEVKRVATTIDPRELDDHPLSIKVYGVHVDDEFVESVAASIHQPIIVASDRKTIISGHRRKHAAIKSKVYAVPVVVRLDMQDEFDIARAVIDSNKQRIKTPEIIGRETAAIEDIEAKRAKARMGRAKTGSKGTAADIAAKEAGVSRNTAHKAQVVAKAIDTAKESGNEDAVEKIRSEKTVNGAYRKAVESVPEVAPQPREQKQTLRTVMPFNNSLIDECMAKIVKLMDERARRMNQSNSPRHTACIEAAGSLLEAWKEWKGSR